MRRLRFVLGDQLSRDLSSLRGLDPATDVVLMAEVADETSYVPHHPQKVVFILSAMRHFAGDLAAAGITVDYVRLDDPANTGSFGSELVRAVERIGPDAVLVTEPGEWRVLEILQDARETLPVPLTILDDDRFICSRAEFAAWAEDRKTYRMEFFYREMRRKTGLLMDGDAPVGGQWNFDAENRKPLPRDMRLPQRLRFPPDPITADVADLVRRRFPERWGSLDRFGWAVTRDDALRALEEFATTALPNFGDHQDAMKAGEPFLFHGLVSPYLNAGLLDPREVCLRAEREWCEGRAPLNAVYGFVRQVLGWREYVRGLYWLRMPDYARTNALAADRPLPAFYWTGETDMNCLRQCVGDTMAHAYAHHIQRLMVLGNFALIAGLAPAEVEAWFLAVYADAYEWVELPNVHGMVLFADGGVLASKPYAASGAYIDRMSDYCSGCRFDPDVKSGEHACPFNPLYWDFLVRNEARLAGNPRMAMPYRTLSRMSPERRAEIARDAERILSAL